MKYIMLSIVLATVVSPMLVRSSDENLANIEQAWDKLTPSDREKILRIIKERLREVRPLV